MNKLAQLNDHKQSFWLDYIRRDLMSSGELKRMIDEDGLRGMTSNPTIFQKAMASGDMYDASIKKASKKGRSTLQVFEDVAIEDIQKAADVLRPVYNASHATDGYVSLEVNPYLANDTAGTIKEALRLAHRVKRPNLMIKVPGTKEGIPAVQALVSKGLNINITLLFSVRFYKQVVEAYIKGLEARVRKGQPIKNISSVASFFVSRVDASVDKQLDKIIHEGGPFKDVASEILHKIAVANAKLAYEHYMDVFNSARFKKLLKKGAQDQRLLWASTGQKDKRLPDTFYIDELIGPQTVNTIPPATADAFKDHGTLENRLLTGLGRAKEAINSLGNIGISLGAVTQTLQEKGVQSFKESFDSLLHVVEAKRQFLEGTVGQNQVFSLGKSHGSYHETLSKMKDEKWIEKIWNKDANLWKSDEDHKKIILNSLGWLRVMDVVENNLPVLDEIVKDIKKSKFTHILLLGMGGSSLCPEVLRVTFGKKSGFPDLAILDSTEPASVAQRASRAKPEKTLFIVASKSGSTTEPNAFLATFYDLVKKKKGAKAGDNFIAITDPGTMMNEIAKLKKFRHIVLNPPDIGGRYSALSFFGMLPAALAGIDVKALLESAKKMAASCSPYTPVEHNAGGTLGAALGALAKDGRDKLTFVLSKDIYSFSTWAEQLIAESTGKDGVGIVPIESEGLEGPDQYTDDRAFVYIRTKSKKDATTEKKLNALQKAGFPVIRITIDNKTDIAGEFFRWEFATAVAGAVLGINPFDQPNVQEAKDLTKQLLKEYKDQGEFKAETPIYDESALRVYTTNGVRPTSSLEDVVKALLAEIKPHDYVALLAYIERDDKNIKALQEIRHIIQKEKKVATTIGFGPRFLHSTGQLHKGGGNNGVFISITADDKKDLPVPGMGITYAILKEAQARGDWGALKNKGRRAFHFHFKDEQAGLATLQKILKRIGK